jgi:hypothetical protein
MVSSSTLAECLIGRGCHVHYPYSDESDYFKVSVAGGASCDLTVDDEDSSLSQNLSIDAQHVQPGQVAAVVARILAADYTSPEQYAHLHKGVPLVGAVGRDMKARGLTVEMETFEDYAEFRVTADVVITNPAQPQRGEVSISDDGWLAWTATPTGSQTSRTPSPPPSRPSVTAPDCLQRSPAPPYVQAASGHIQPT